MKRVDIRRNREHRTLKTKKKIGERKKKGCRHQEWKEETSPALEYAEKEKKRASYHPANGRRNGYPHGMIFRSRREANRAIAGERQSHGRRKRGRKVFAMAKEASEDFS